MSFAGHVLDMINRNKQNLALKKSRRERYAKVKEAYQQQLSQRNQTIMRYSDLSKSEVETIRHHIRVKLIREQRVFWVRSMLLIGLLIYVMYRLVVFYI
jgi:hypothetical protein